MFEDAKGYASITKKCLKEFSKCRQYEDIVGRFIYGCDINMTENTSKLKNLVGNLDALESAQTDVSKSASTKQSITCSEFVEISKTLKDLATQCPFTPYIEEKGKTFVGLQCSGTEKDSITANLEGARVIISNLVFVFTTTHTGNSYSLHRLSISVKDFDHS